MYTFWSQLTEHIFTVIIMVILDKVKVKIVVTESDCVTLFYKVWWWKLIIFIILEPLWILFFIPLIQFFSTFFGSWHTFLVKTFGDSLTLVNYCCFEARKKLIIDKFHNEYQEITRKRKSNIWRHPMDLFTAPWLRTTALIRLNRRFNLLVFRFLV